MATQAKKPQLETDHEFKTRMAAEGRAVYIPGKTTAELKVESDWPVNITMRRADASLAAGALDDLLRLIDEASSAVDLMSEVIADSKCSDHPGIGPALFLIGRAMRGAEFAEGRALEEVIRHGLSVALQDKRTADIKAGKDVS